MADNETITPIPGIENLTYEDVSILLNAQRLWMELVAGGISGRNESTEICQYLV